MAYNFHTDKEKYFGFQYDHSREYIIPFIKDFLSFDNDPKILEIGSAEAGVLKAFTDLRLKCTGIEIEEGRAQMAMEFMANEIQSGLIDFIISDVYRVNPSTLKHKYDLIILKDVIEHIHDQRSFLQHIKEFLNTNGLIFFTMPPWYMPFGGHQQMCDSSILKRLPWFHLLPKRIYKKVLEFFGETTPNINVLLETWDTQLTIRNFEKLCKQTNYKFEKRVMYLKNPTYKYKFNLKPREQFKIIAAIPFVRDFFTTSVYYLVRKQD